MSRTKPFRLVRKRRVIPYSRRGAIYAWLRTHVVQVRSLRGPEQRPWALLIADMIDDGVTELDGSPPTVGNVSKSWQRVLRDIAVCEAAALALPKRPSPASSMSVVTHPPLSAVQPPPYVPMPIPRSAPLVPRAFTGRTPAPPPPGSPGAAAAATERMERFMQSIRAMSRKPNPF